MAYLAPNSIVTLYCDGNLPGKRYLRGDTQNGEVALGDSTDLRAQWKVIETAKGFSLECQGPAAGLRWLDGRTVQKSVGLAPNTDPPFTGATWKVRSDPTTNSVILDCLGDVVTNWRYLDGQTVKGTVSLAPSTQGAYTGTRWIPNIVSKPPPPPGAHKSFMVSRSGLKFVLPYQQSQNMIPAQSILTSVMIMSAQHPVMSMDVTHSDVSGGFVKYDGMVEGVHSMAFNGMHARGEWVIDVVWEDPAHAPTSLYLEITYQ